MFKAIITAAIIATPVTAQQQDCAARPVVVDYLQDRYGETRHSIGMDGNGAVIEVWGNSDTGTWSVTFTMPNGMMCVASSGGSFERLAEALPNSDEQL